MVPETPPLKSCWMWTGIDVHADQARGALSGDVWILSWGVSLSTAVHLAVFYEVRNASSQSAGRPSTIERKQKLYRDCPFTVQ
jgi:hypothetical protein